MSLFDNLDTIDPFNCGLSPEAAKQFAVQVELMRVLKKHYPECMTGDSAKDSYDSLRDLAMITGALLAAIRIKRNDPTFKFVVIKYLENLAADADSIAKGTSDILKHAARSLH